jgi:hypothetical protein
MRNDQILKEFDRVENHMKALHSKTENYAIMKVRWPSNQFSLIGIPPKANER